MDDINAWVPVIIAWITLAGTIVTAVMARPSKKQMEIEAEEALHKAQQSLSLATNQQVETVMGLLDRMRKSQEKLRDQLDKQDRQISYLRGRVTILIRVVRDLYQGACDLVEQIEELDMDPVWRPDPSIQKIIRVAEEDKNG